MEPTQLQLVFNVVTITGVTSLAGYCYLLKKENRKLATEARRRLTERAQTAAPRDGLQPVGAGYPNLRFRPPQPMGEGPGIVDFALGFCFDADLLQRFRLMLQFRLAGGKLADAEHVGQTSASCSRVSFPGRSAGMVVRILSKRSPTVRPFQLEENSPPVRGGADSPPPSALHGMTRSCSHRARLRVRLARKCRRRPRLRSGDPGLDARGEALHRLSATGCSSTELSYSSAGCKQCTRQSRLLR